MPTVPVRLTVVRGGEASTLGGREEMLSSRRKASGQSREGEGASSVCESAMAAGVAVHFSVSVSVLRAPVVCGAGRAVGHFSSPHLH